ncbi:MAG TPA: hypothetical protein VGN64_14490 [Dyadobacter sp.]|jgi:hypothetical protein|uniref:hypothetical protein n=1 Tax=Dyadobacter luteus TaxID=2259619 RepID=UPI00131411B3|nr:hypothetical protein [Dyadobacter luteus]HEV7381004.1 hypothetical protein [Dyadobacter sp.]
MDQPKKPAQTSKKSAKKALDELNLGANKIIGDNIHGGWVEVIKGGITPDKLKLDDE